jgi:hypothetical protein
MRKLPRFPPSMATGGHLMLTTRTMFSREKGSKSAAKLNQEIVERLVRAVWEQARAATAWRVAVRCIRDMASLTIVVLIHADIHKNQW